MSQPHVSPMCPLLSLHLLHQFFASLSQLTLSRGQDPTQFFAASTFSSSQLNLRSVNHELAALITHTGTSLRCKRGGGAVEGRQHAGHGLLWPGSRCPDGAGARQAYEAAPHTSMRPPRQGLGSGAGVT